MDLNTLKNKTLLSIKFEWNTVQLGKKSKEVPSPRWGHSMTLTGDSIFIFGGYADAQYMNDTWRFDLEEAIWEKLSATGNVPDKRSNHTAVYDQSRERILVFGGGGTTKKRYNDTYVYNIKKNEYNLLQTSGLLPVARTYHTSFLLADLMIVYGGEGVADLDDLHLLNLNNCHWTEPKIKGKKPAKRRFHASTVLDHKIFIFGGCNGSYSCLNDLFMLDFKEFLKSRDYESLEWVEIKAKGESPTPRWGHSTISHGDHIYVFGGRCTVDFNDVHRFSLKEEKWEQVSTEGEPPSGRRRQTMEVCGNQMIIFGGYNINYFNSMHFLNLPHEMPPRSFKEKQNYIIKYWKKEKILDATFLVENRTLSAHKIVLHLADPGFDHIFNQNLSSSVIELPEIKYKPLKGIINYCYVKSLAPNSNLGYILNLRFTAKKLGLHNIEKDMLSILAERQMTSKKKNKKIKCFNMVQKNLILECPEEEMPIESLDSNKGEEDRLKDMWKRFTSLPEHHQDIKLHINNHTFNCHRVMLASGGSFFKNLLMKNFKESNANSVSIKGIPSNIFTFVLSFIYFEEEFLQLPAPTLQEADWISLLKVAQYLSLWKLITFCEINLLELIDPRNIFPFLELSLSFHCDWLERGCLIYVVNNYYSLELRKQLIKFINTAHRSDFAVLQRLRAFCEEMKFYIYQKGVMLKNCHTNLHNLSDILFDNKATNSSENDVTACFNYEDDEANLNTSNYYHLNNSINHNEQTSKGMWEKLSS